MSRILTALISACAVGLVACASTYRWNDITYSSAEDALAAEKRDLGNALSKVQPLNARPAGTLRMYHIDQDMAPKLLVRAVGQGQVRGEQADYIINATYNGVRSLRDAIEKRAIYEKVELKYAKGEHHEPEAGVDVMYLYAPDTTTQAWYFVSKSVPRTPVQFDTGQKDMYLRWTYFLDTLEALAMAERAKASAATSSFQTSPTPSGPLTAPNAPVLSSPTSSPKAPTALSTTPAVAPAPSPMVAAPASAASLSPPAAGGIATPNSPSKYMINAERFAKSAGCQAAVATMNISTPGYESFAITCANAEPLLVRCDYGNCRALK